MTASGSWIGDGSAARGQPCVYIFAFEGWDEVEELAKLLVREFGVRQKRRIEGPYAKLWDLERDGIPFVLTHDDMAGNDLAAETTEGAATIRKLGAELDAYLTSEHGPRAEPPPNR